MHLDADLAGLADYTHALATDRTPERPFLLLGQMTTADPTRSPEGTESVWAYTHLPRRPWSSQEVDDRVTRIEAVVESHAPGFLERVIGRSVQGPDQLAAADANLGLGSINAGTSQLFQQLVLRPTPSLGRAETFIDGLYLAGASAHPGGGVHGACGSNAARAAHPARSVDRAARVVGLDRIRTSARALAPTFETSFRDEGSGREALEQRVTTRTRAATQGRRRAACRPRALAGRGRHRSCRRRLHRPPEQPDLCPAAALCRSSPLSCSFRSW